MNRQNVTDPLTSVYVDASAGSGKTKLLVDRIVRLLLSDAIPSRILCITFTNAAADEMNDRLHSKLLSLLTMTDQELYNNLYELSGVAINQLMIKRARGLFAKFIADSPKIQTLHAFCAKILNKMQIINLNESLINETSRIIDDEEKLDLLHESFNEMIIDKENFEVQKALNTTLKRYDASYIFELISELWGQISSSSNIQFTSEYLTTDEAIDGIKSRIYQFCDVDVSTSIDDIINEYIISCDDTLLIEVVEVLSRGENITSKLAADAIKKFIEQGGEEAFYDYVNVLLTSNFKPRARLPLSTAICKEYDHLRQFLVEQQEALCNIIEKIHSQNSAKFNSGFNIIAWYTLQKFNQKKKNLGLFEYSDLIKNTTKIIHNSDDKMALLYSIDMSLEHILVDEAQDLSEMQWVLIKTITDEFFAGIGTTTNRRTIFIVGDFKQAIFGFQGSAPQVFQEVKQYFRNKVISVGQDWYEIQLETCYRCPPEILEVVDKVCNSVKNSFNILDDNVIKHNSIMDYGYGMVQCHEIDSELTSKIKQKITWNLPGSEQPMIDKDQHWHVAQKIAETIDKWLTDRKKISALDQFLEPQDIMILLRKRSALQDYLVDALKLYNISTSNLAAKIFGNSIYIYDLLALLRFILQPFDNMNLVALLKSHPFNYNENQIFQLCYKNNSNLYEAVKDIQFIRELIYNSKVMDLKTFFQWYLDAVYKLENAETLRFMDYIFTYYQTTNPIKISMQNFMVWLHDLMGQKQQRLYDNRSVRITTVHSAKGLEAPVVILADAYASDRLSGAKFAYEDDIFVLNTKNSSQSIKSLITRTEMQLKMENMRLLYVAMTRPKRELHVFGTYNCKESWYSMIKSAI